MLPQFLLEPTSFLRLHSAGSDACGLCCGGEWRVGVVGLVDAGLISIVAHSGWMRLLGDDAEPPTSTTTTSALVVIVPFVVS